MNSRTPTSHTRQNISVLHAFQMNPEDASSKKNKRQSILDNEIVENLRKEKLYTEKNEEINMFRINGGLQEKVRPSPYKNEQLHEEQYEQVINEKDVEMQRKNGRKNNFPLQILNTQNEKVKNERRRNQLEIAKQILSGKISIIWIFIIQKQLEKKDEKRIQSIYNGLSQKNYLVPICRNESEAQQFLSVPNSLFKIVADLANIQSAIQKLDNPKIVQFYIFNEKGQKGVSEALAFKSRTQKIKAIFTGLDTIIDRAEEEIQSQIQMFKAQNGISTRKFDKIFPSFLRLSGEDKTNATQYRANLYGSKNLNKNQRKAHYENFMQYVEEKYGSEEKEKLNILQYSKLDHFGEQLSMILAKQIIKFYVRESFYYRILNSMLRIMKTTQEFKPCVFPFYETYHAIKMIYMNQLTANKRKIEAQTLYRGAKLRPKDFKSLNPNIYIEMYGFMSTSKVLSRAKQFTDRRGYIFVIHVPEMNVETKNDKYDHGFIDVNKHQLTPEKKYEVEEEVLFNALNIFKVLKIEEKDSFKFIHLEYGSIFSILAKQKSSLTTDEKDVLINYQFCTNMFNQIQDQGDVYLFNNELESSKLFYQSKICQGEKNDRYFHKLANIQQKCGEINQANKNIKRALQIQQQNLVEADRETCLKVFSIHAKNAEISMQNEDYLSADEAINKALQLLPDDQLFEKAKKIRQRGEVKFKKGEIRNSEIDFDKSEQILKNLARKTEEERRRANPGFLTTFFERLFCGGSEIQAEQKERQEKLQKIMQMEEEIRNIKKQINEELIKVNNSLKEVALFADDKFKYENCVQKARKYLLQIKSEETNDPRQKSRLKALEATVQSFLNLAQSEKLLNQAIQIIETESSFDPDVGKYATILAKIQKDELNKFSIKGIKGARLQKGMKKIQYDQKLQNEIYERCQNNFQKAINVLLHNNHKHSSPEVMKLKNEIGQLNFNEANYVKSEKIIREVKAASLNNKHSEIAKSCLLLSKICYARGQLKNAFDNVSQSEEILKKAILKSDDQMYRRIYQRHELYRELLIHRAKIYMQQLNHEMSIRDLNSLQDVFCRRIEDNQSENVMADLYQLIAENLILHGHQDFSKSFDRAIQLRQKQMGKYNLHNGITYCNYAKYMILSKNMEKAQYLLQKAFQIFSFFDEDHPITWLVFYCIGIFKEGKNQFEESLSSVSRSIHIAENKFDKDHITLCKIKFQYGRILAKAKKHQLALKCFMSLESQLSQKLNENLKSNVHQKEGDDEKVSIYRLVYSSIIKCQKQIEGVEDSSPIKQKKEQVEMRMDILKKFISFEDEQVVQP